MRKHILLSFLVCSLLSGANVFAQSISGVVTDEAGNTLAGASIVVQGTAIGGITNVDGAFSLDYPLQDN